jgi:hypothetical protein
VHQLRLHVPPQALRVRSCMHRSITSTSMDS